MKSRGFPLILAFLVCLVLTGCGSASDPIPELVPLNGKVAMDGEPIAGVHVIFHPWDGTLGTGASGVTDQTGRYRLLHRTRVEGVQPGTYLVTFSKLAMPDGSPIPIGKDAADVGAQEWMPARYTDPDNERSAHIITVAETGGTFDFELNSK
jgi:hypothetical protein